MFGQRFFYWLFEQVFPRACLGCRLGGVDVCEACLGACAPEPRWDTHEFGEVWTGFAYENTLVSAMLQGWKYHRQRSLSGALLAVTPFPRVEGCTAVVAVPLHRRRLLERGFNQAEEIASHYAGLTELPLVHSLVRTRYTKAQAQMGPEARIANVEGAFAWEGEPLSGQVILIDDVCTTGSTLSACARVLRAAGAEKITAICIARGGK